MANVGGGLSNQEKRLQRAGLTKRGGNFTEFRTNKVGLVQIDPVTREPLKKGTKAAQGEALEADSIYWQCATDIEYLKDFYFEKGFAAPPSLTTRDGISEEWARMGQSRSETTFNGSAGKPYLNAKEPKYSYGLTHAEAAQMLALYGENKLTPPPEDPEWLKFLRQFTGFFSLLLEAGGLLCFIAYGVDQESAENLYLGIVLWVVVTITSIFTYQQESASAAMMEKFRGKDIPKNTVKREGQETKVECTKVVPGDLIQIKLGEKIPCDIRVIEASSSFAVTEAALTGEPFPIKKNNSCAEQKKKYGGSGKSVGRAGDTSFDAMKKDKDKGPALRQTNIIMNGTDISEGECWGVVCTTGDQTIMGRNYQMMLQAKASKDETPIKKEIDRFVEIITSIAVFLGVLFFIVNMAYAIEIVKSIVFTIGIIVANVPEGLLATVTVSLALTAERMKDVMVLVKNLEAVETLGSTSVICSDKTGTLTQNKMTVVKAFVDGQVYDTHPIEQCAWKGGTNGPQHPDKHKGQNPFYEVQKCSILCGSARFDVPEDPERAAGAKKTKTWEELDWSERQHADGDASEKALLIFNEKRLKDFKNCGLTSFKGHSYINIQDPNPEGPLKNMKYETLKETLKPKQNVVGEQKHEWKEAGATENCDYCTYGSLVQTARNDCKLVDKLPFDSKNKWMAITTYMGNNVTERNESGNPERYVTWIKGGSDVVYAFCTHTIKRGQVVPLDEQDKRDFAENNANLANDGLRVFAFAKVSFDILNDNPQFDNGENLEEAKKYFNGTQQGGGMKVTSAWEPGETDENGNMPTGEKPVTVKGKAQIPLVRADIARKRKDAGGTLVFVPKVVFLGLLALQDPPRPAVPRAVAVCRAASIGVVMVTGDQPATAAAIARNIGIIAPGGKTEDDVLMDQLLSEPGKTKGHFAKEKKRLQSQMKPEAREAITAMAVQGGEIGDWNTKAMDNNWKESLKYIEKGYDGLVFARTSPTQKLLIVQHFKIPEDKGGPEKIVAVTGDGVNDAQAVTAADIGICMGIAGMDVTKEAADMILMNDNFASIVDGVLEGRLIFDNLKKSIAYTLSSNIPEISPFVFFILLRIPLPLSTVLILCIDLGTDMVPAISLAYETKEKDIMKRPPRTKTDNLVTERLISFSYFQIGCVQALAGFYVYMVVLYTEGIPPAELPEHGELQLYFDPDGYAFGGFSITENLMMQRKAQSAFWVSIVIVQWADILICKTRRLSLFEQGMKNDQLNFGLFFETALAVCLIYLPGVSTVFGIEKLRFIYWLPAFPFGVLILTYDELRKWLIRTFEGGWLDRKTYW